MRLRTAREEDAEKLTRIARAAKASWGYPADWLSEWAPILTITADYLRTCHVIVADDPDEILGFAALQDGELGPEIDHLWVDPSRQGEGVGRALIRRLLLDARRRGWDSVRVESDPHARAFYERMGGVRIGEVSVPVGEADRRLPVLRLSTPPSPDPGPPREVLAVRPSAADAGAPPLRPADVDHLVYAGPQLSAGIERIGTLLGAAPVPGGRHPRYGTHNALLALGDGAYLEVIAPDPEAPRPPNGLPFGMGDPERWRLATWALRREPIDAAVAEAAAAVGAGRVEEGRRARADGVLLSWVLTDPYAMPLDGVVPFLISWGETPHPSTSAPPGGKLTGLRIEHPEPERVRAALEVLDTSARVDAADAVALVATIETARGIVELR